MFLIHLVFLSIHRILAKVTHPGPYKQPSSKLGGDRSSCLSSKAAIPELIGQQYYKETKLPVICGPQIETTTVAWFQESKTEG